MASEDHSKCVPSLFELIGKRWTLLLIWELQNGPATSRMLRQKCGVSPSVLQTRIDELRSARLILVGRSGYELTGLGKELVAALKPLSDYAVRWVHSRTAA